MKTVQIITDGACLGNPGRGGWACILRYGDASQERYGFEPYTTNNRMELMAAIQGLRALKEACEVEIVTDSEYLKHGITQWIKAWKKNGWVTSARKPVLNRDLWEALDEEIERHKVTWTWTRGHGSHEDNNRADELASRAAREQRASL